MGGTATTSSFCPVTINTIADFLNFFTCLISKSVIPLLIALAVIVFIWGVLKFIMNADDSTKREEGRNFIIWGLVGLFVMVSIWGIVNILNNTFGVSNVIPQLPM
ncbi:MAG: hypothetical protein KBD26_03690 [Candidatus Pacebacteria bacterium]|nr:hypothetical protein [Candidatus Paceibacterota bacterium]MBP9772906.1 hypothetical protein [Candidatus Paceibacterota bacterium]QQR76399.1 MAG: hypothetical protein IPJ63_02760 [Candidatus Nomurabacteria bacterium]